jgi:hypothetical protein
MGTRLNRRQFSISAMALLACAAVSAPAQAGGTRTIRIRALRPKALAGLTGEKLRAALADSLLIEMNGAEILPVALVGVQVREGQVADVFMSNRFNLTEEKKGQNGGISFLPGDMYIPGEMYLPGDMYIPGEMYIPGDMYVPTSGVEHYAAKSAVDALARMGSKNGLFFVVVTADTAARNEFTSSGTALASVPVT